MNNVASCCSCDDLDFKLVVFFKLSITTIVCVCKHGINERLYVWCEFTLNDLDFKLVLFSKLSIVTIVVCLEGWDKWKESCINSTTLSISHLGM